MLVVIPVVDGIVVELGIDVVTAVVVAIYKLLPVVVSAADCIVTWLAIGFVMVICAAPV